VVLYKHTQVGRLGLVLLALGAVATITLLQLQGLSVPRHIVLSVVVTALVLIVLVFSALTVEVATERLSLWFGPGIIRKRFRAEDIRAVSAVRNHWYYGWGIRLTPHGWLFCVSGLDAVEIRLSSGRTYRIGTDQPQELLAAIRRARNGVTVLKKPASQDVTPPISQPPRSG
jgi:hypothetical protein